MPYSEPHSAFPVRRARTGIVQERLLLVLSLDAGFTMPATKRVAANADRQADHLEGTLDGI